MAIWAKEEQAEHRRKWVEALRSGKYYQITGALRNALGHCCLGVACEISGLVKWKEAENEAGYLYGAYTLEAVVDLDTDDEAIFTTELPEAVCDWLGVRYTDGGFQDESGIFTSLANANDKGVTFAEIANIIESAPDSLLAT